MSKRIATLAAAVLVAVIGGYAVFLAAKPPADTPRMSPGGRPAWTPAAKSVLSLAFNNRCDVIVATVVAGAEPVAQEQAVLEFLNADVVRHWAEAILGL